MFEMVPMVQMVLTPDLRADKCNREVLVYPFPSDNNECDSNVYFTNGLIAIGGNRAKMVLFQELPAKACCDNKPNSKTRSNGYDL